MSPPEPPRRVRVAVVDSGVHPAHPHIIAARIAAGVAVFPDGSLGTGPDATLDRLGHGTAVAAAIQEWAPAADLLPVRVFHDGLKAGTRALAAALEWCVAAGVDIVNLSLGTMNPAHRPLFAALVERAVAAEVLIVAPHAADGLPCWPGALDGVLGVGLDPDLPRGQYRAEGGVLFTSGHPRPIPGVAQRHNLHGISFATAQVSGFAARACATLPPRRGGQPQRLRERLLRPAVPAAAVQNAGASG